MGTVLGNSTEDLRLLYIPTTTKVGPHFHPYKTYSPDDQADLTGRKITRTPNSDNYHLPHSLELCGRTRRRGHEENGVHVGLEDEQRRYDIHPQTDLQKGHMEN